MRSPPWLAVAAKEYPRIALAACGQRAEQGAPSSVNTICRALPALDSRTVIMPASAFSPPLATRQFTIPTTCQKRSTNNFTEVRRASVDEAALLVLREISDHRCVHPLERRDAAPRVVRRHDAFTPRMVEGGLQDSQYAVRRSSAFADRVTTGSTFFASFGSSPCLPRA